MIQQRKREPAARQSLRVISGTAMSPSAIVLRSRAGPGQCACNPGLPKASSASGNSSFCSHHLAARQAIVRIWTRIIHRKQQICRATVRGGKKGWALRTHRLHFRQIKVCLQPLFRGPNHFLGVDHLPHALLKLFRCIHCPRCNELH